MNESAEDELRNRAADPPPAVTATGSVIGAVRGRRRRTAMLGGATLLAVVAVGAAAPVVFRGGGNRESTSVSGWTGASAPTPSRTAADLGMRPPSADSATGPEDRVVGIAYPYYLYTHCGIRYARFGGRLVARPARVGRAESGGPFHRRHHDASRPRPGQVRQQQTGIHRGLHP